MNVSLYIDDMICYVENPKESILKKKLLELISKFSKGEGYKINTHQSIALLHTNNKHSKRNIKKTISIYNRTKKHKILRNQHDTGVQRLVQ